jgi:hypothetical protein
MFFMAHNFQFKTLPGTIARCLKASKSLGLTISAGVSGSLLFLANPAAAVETIELQFQDRTITVTLEEIRTFAETREPSTELGAFIAESEEVADIVGTLLTEEITLSPTFRERVRTNLQGSSLGQFLLTQISQFIQGSTELTALENAIQASLQDNNRLSILEIAENYTADVDRVTINLTEAEVVYRDVRGFVERVLPAVEVAREFLQDALCDCPTVTEVSEPSAPSAPSDSDPSDADVDTPQSVFPNSLTPVRTANQVNCPPTVMAELEAEIEAELEAEIEAELEARAATQQRN